MTRRVGGPGTRSRLVAAPLAALALLLAACAELSGEPQLQGCERASGPLIVPGLAREERRPVAVLIERGPCAAGATVPTVIVYEDGLIVRSEVDRVSEQGSDWSGAALRACARR